MKGSNSTGCFLVEVHSRSDWSKNISAFFETVAEAFDFAEKIYRTEKIAEAFEAVEIVDFEKAELVRKITF